MLEKNFFFLFILINVRGAIKTVSTRHTNIMKLFIIIVPVISLKKE